MSKQIWIICTILGLGWISGPSGQEFSKLTLTLVENHRPRLHDFIRRYELEVLFGGTVSLCIESLCPKHPGAGYLRDSIPLRISHALSR